jgi:hypothetical protein
LQYLILQRSSVLCGQKTLAFALSPDLEKAASVATQQLFACEILLLQNYPNQDNTPSLLDLGMFIIPTVESLVTTVCISFEPGVVSL